MADDSFKKHLADKGYTHYLALQVKTLLPYKDLHEKLTKVQAEVIDVLGAGIYHENSGDYDFCRVLDFPLST